MIIYIHGIGAHPPKAQWKRDWDLALFGKPMPTLDRAARSAAAQTELRTTMAYWSDLLHPPGSATTRRIRSASPDAGDAEDDQPLDVDEIIREAKVPRDQRSAAADRLMKIAAAVGYVATDDGDLPQGRGISTKIFGGLLPERARRWATERFLRRFLKDVAVYFYQPGTRTAIQDRLRTEIRKVNRPFTLVSHSLGTVVAFEVLSDKQFRRQDCSLFVTLGSPLGIDEVQDVLTTDFGHSLIVPERVHAWYNFAARFDPVAADPALRNDYQPRLVGNRTVRVIDERLVNRDWNPHSSLGYLSHPDIRTVVHHHVGFDSSGRFLVARDVMQEFVEPTRRIPILIEVLEPGYTAVDEVTSEMAEREFEQSDAEQTLSGRITALRDKVVQLAIDHTLGSKAKKSEIAELRNDIAPLALRKYVAANLTPDEINSITDQHREFNIYAMWKNSAKKKLLRSSHIALKADAGRSSYGAGGDGVIWAVLDTGIRWDHPHFLTHNTIREIWDCTTGSDTPELIMRDGFVENDYEPEDGDRDGHGTHVAGIIAGEYADKQHRIMGLAPRTKLVIYKVLDDDGYGNDAWIIKAIDHIFHQNQSVVSGLKIHGVNLSLGGPFDATVYGCGFSPICKELRDLWRQGTLVCVAAGNEGQIEVQTSMGRFDLNTQLSIGDPANLEDCVAVGSVNRDKPHLYGVSWFSSRGPTADGRPKPDVVAPGERIESCSARFPAARGNRKPTFRQLYRAESGTSMACPHIAGLLAAFLSVRREYIGRPDEVKQILLNNCNDLGRDRYHQGAGLPNLMKMLTNT